MIKINLVPEYIKQEQKMDRILNLNTQVLIIFTLSIIITSGIVLYSRLALENINAEFLKQDALITTNAKSYNNKVKDINEKINTISKIQLENFDWTGFLANFGKLVPQNIIVNATNFNHNTDMFSISGVAKNRDDLLALRNNLVSSGLITGYEFPISTMLQKENIKFDISAAINYTATSTKK